MEDVVEICKSGSTREKSRENFFSSIGSGGKLFHSLAAIIKFQFHDEIVRFSHTHTKPLRHQLAALMMK